MSYFCATIRCCSTQPDIRGGGGFQLTLLQCYCQVSGSNSFMLKMLVKVTGAYQGLNHSGLGNYKHNGYVFIRESFHVRLGCGTFYSFGKMLPQAANLCGARSHSFNETFAYVFKEKTAFSCRGFSPRFILQLNSFASRLATMHYSAKALNHSSCRSAALKKRHTRRRVSLVIMWLCD